MTRPVESKNTWPKVKYVEFGEFRCLHSWRKTMYGNQNPPPIHRTKSAIALLKSEVKALQWRYPAFLVLILVFTSTSLLPPQLFLFYTNRLSTIGSIDDVSALEFLRILIGFGLCVAMVMLTVGVVSVVVEEWICLRIEANLRHRALNAIHGIAMDELDSAQRGDWLTRMSGDLRSVEQFLSTTAPGHVQSILTILIVTIVLALHSASLAAVMLISATLLGFVNVIVQKRTQPELDRIRELHGDILQSLLENFEGLASIRSLGAEAEMRGWFTDKVNRIMQASLRVMRTIGVLVGGNSATTNILITFCLTGSAWYLMHGRVSLKEALAVPFYIGMFYRAALSLTGAAIDWSRFVANAGRLGDMLGQLNSLDIAKCSLNLTSIPTALQLTSVQVAVPGRLPLTKPFDLALRTGQLIVVQGPSGCGKSTFLQMLAGLRPFSQGNLALDYDASVRVHEKLTLDDQNLWIPRELCCYVEQRPFLFESSIRDNVVLGMSQKPEDATLWQALACLQLDSFVESRGGLDAALADHGKNLSEGQKYRLALARALLGSRPFILLDEPFSALDTASAAMVCRAFAQMRQNCGLIIVSHIIPLELSDYDLLDFSSLKPSSPVRTVQNAIESIELRRKNIVGLAPSIMVPHVTRIDCDMNR